MNRKTLIILSMGILSFLLGCKNKNSNSQQVNDHENVRLEEITSRIDPEEGWFDIFMQIISEVKTDSSHIYITKGLYKENVVGLQIEINSNIGAGIVNGELNGKTGFCSNAVNLQSIGVESDNLIKALAELYQVPITKDFTKKPITANIFSLNDRVVNLDKKDYYKLKLFFEEDNEELYSEIYLNINTERREIEIHEKDEEYREPIIKVWTK
jgi:hypothetical protein